MKKAMISLGLVLALLLSLTIPGFAADLGGEPPAKPGEGGAGGGPAAAGQEFGLLRDSNFVKSDLQWQTLR